MGHTISLKKKLILPRIVVVVVDKILPIYGEDSIIRGQLYVVESRYKDCHLIHYPHGLWGESIIMALIMKC